MTPPLIPFRGRVWRTLAADRASDPTGPARHGVGRFHHSGQTTIYTSLTPEGAEVALARYVEPGDWSACGLHWMSKRRVSSICGRRGRGPSIVWQDICAAGAPSPTWAYSDAARARGADGLLYRSRSRPDLVHLVLFAARLLRARPDGATAWPATG